jgi:alkylated DNA repair protein alkB family protein 6
MATQANIPSDLSAYRITALPPSFYYIPNFLTPTEEQYILQKAGTVPRTHIPQLLANTPQIPANRWTQLSKRRLQAHPSTLSKSNTLIAAPLPDYLTTFPAIRERFKQLGIFEHTKHGEANHVLINEYNPGEGIMPHEDGAAYAPVVATISLSAPIVLDIYEKGADGQAQRAIKYRILQEPGSLLVTTAEAYENLLHGISPNMRDENLNAVVNWELLGDKKRFELMEGGAYERATRVSLTYRDVLKVSKAIGFLGKR